MHYGLGDLGHIPVCPIKVVWKLWMCGKSGNFLPRSLVNINMIKCLAAAAAKSLLSCPTPCDPIDGSPPGSPVPGILQARTLAWVATSFSNAWKWKVKVKSLSHVWLFATPWTVAHQAPPSMGFSRQEHWRGLPLPSPKCLATAAKLIKVHNKFLLNWTLLFFSTYFSICIN